MTSGRGGPVSHRSQEGGEAGDDREEAFRLRGVRVERGGRVVLDELDLDVPAGRVTVVMGPSGSGKTSLLRVLNRLDDPAEGTVLYRGRRVSEYPVRELRRRVGFVFQRPVMFEGSVRDNLRVTADLSDCAGGGAGEAEERIRESLELAGLDEELLDRPGEELSVGQQQRANLARALVSRPETLLLDEPTSALDALTSRRLLRTFPRLVAEQGRTEVMATHREEEGRAVGDRAVRVHHGRGGRPRGAWRSSSDAPPSRADLRAGPLTGPAGGRAHRG